MKYFVLPLLLVTAACGGHVNAPSAEPITVPVEVAIPVASPCVPDTLAPAPSYADTDEALVGAADAAERYQLLWAGRGQRISRLNEIEPIVAGCPKGHSEKK